jgi:acetyl-CoA carboxylase carboxyl transferase subunit alpha
LRPHFKDYLETLFESFIELSGDRRYSNDHAIIGGLAKFNDKSVMVIGHEKGSSTDERIKHNFGMASPEGYRKAGRLMEIANRFQLPIITIVDTAGAYPGIGAEQRGQSEAIARCTQVCLNVRVPLVSLIIGEGGSGGAVALASANKVIMLEHSIYTVASPEASASILWRDSSKASYAANTMKITAQDLIEFGVIDSIIAEPVGGAHRDPQKIIIDAGKELQNQLNILGHLNPEEVMNSRRERFLSIGRNI